jgi:YbgC/YbaW family acyl-CoA thioester hydrolase
MQTIEQERQIAGIHLIPVRRADLDSNGHVNNGTYQSYFEEARIRFLETLTDHNTEGGPSWKKWKILRSEVEYKAELKYKEEINIQTYIDSKQDETIILVQEMYRVSDSALVAKASFAMGNGRQTEPRYFQKENYQYAYYHQVNVGWADMNDEACADLAQLQYYLDDARIRSFIQSGFDLDSLREKGIGPLIYKAEFQYFHKICFPDELVITTVYEKTAKNRFRFVHEMYSKSDRRLLLSAFVYGFFMDLKRKRPYQFDEEEVVKLFKTERPSPFA